MPGDFLSVTAKHDTSQLSLVADKAVSSAEHVNQVARWVKCFPDSFGSYKDRDSTRFKHFPNSTSCNEAISSPVEIEELAT